MRCSNCQADIPVTARFCPNCSIALVTEKDIKSPQEVSVEWLKIIFEKYEYNIEVNPDNQNIFGARRDGQPIMIVELSPSLNLISFGTTFHLKKPGWRQKTELFLALNKANSSHLLFKFYISDKMDSLWIVSSIYLTERISNRDIGSFINVFNEDIFRSLELFGLIKFG